MFMLGNFYGIRHEFLKIYVDILCNFDDTLFCQERQSFHTEVQYEPQMACLIHIFGLRHIAGA